MQIDLPDDFNLKLANANNFSIAIFTFAMHIIKVKMVLYLCLYSKYVKKDKYKNIMKLCKKLQSYLPIYIFHHVSEKWVLFSSDQTRYRVLRGSNVMVIVVATQWNDVNDPCHHNIFCSDIFLLTKIIGQCLRKPHVLWAHDMPKRPFRGS